MAKAKKEQQYYKEIAVDSQEEIAMLQWLHELKDNGYVTAITRASSLLLSCPVINPYLEYKHLKTMVKEVAKEQKLLEKHIYTPEFLVEFSELGAKLFLDNNSLSTGRKKERLFIETGGICAYFEVKPSFDQNSMTRLFKINQKWVYDKYRIYINLVKPGELFEKSFTPLAYLKTPTGKDKKINWSVRSLSEYIDTLQ